MAEAEVFRSWVPDYPHPQGRTPFEIVPAMRNGIWVLCIYDWKGDWRGPGWVANDQGIPLWFHWKDRAKAARWCRTHAPA